MHYLVTGGSGFVGHVLCRDLVRDGHDATVLTRDPARAAARLPPAVRCVGQLEHAAAADAIVNLAGENLADGRWTPARKQRLRASRLDTTRDLVAWIAAQTPRPRVLVSGSAIGWYGARGDEALHEDATPGDDFAAQLCRAWEAEAMRAAELGVRVACVRTGLVVHPSGGALARMLLPFKLGLGGRMGDGRQFMSWIARSDLLRLIRWLAQNDAAHGAYNGTAPAPVRNAEFARILGAWLHRPALLPAPAFALKLLLGEMAELLLSGQRVLPQRAQAQGFAFECAELGQALRFEATQAA